MTQATHRKGTTTLTGHDLEQLAEQHPGWEFGVYWVTLAGGRVVEGPVKTSAGARTIALDPTTVAALRDWHRQQRAEFMRLGVRPAGGYVFTGEGGLPLWPQWITARFRDLCDAPGLRRIGPTGCGTRQPRG